MERKYYDLIIKLIKEHKKYELYADIIDDIAEDVYEHAKVVIGSVANEDVIFSYLNKVVATSMITVPKKLNCTRKSTNLSFMNPVQHDTLKEEDLVTPNVEEAVENKGEEVLPETNLVENKTEEVDVSVEDLEVLESFEIVDSFNELDSLEESNSFQSEIDIDEIEGITESDELEESPVVDFSNEEEEFEEIVESTEESLEQFVESDGIEEFSELSEEVVLSDEDKVIEEKQEDFEDISDTELVPDTDVDINLVDKMINGVPTEPESDDLSLEATAEVIDDSDLGFVEESLAEIEEIAEISDVENLVEVLEPEGLDEESQENILIEDNEVESLGTEVLELDISETQDETLAQEEKFEELTEVNEEPVLETIDDEISNEEIIETVEAVEIAETLQAPVNYDCFSFEPEKVEFDTEEILNDLKSFDSRYPHKRIMDLCNLKYVKNYSITEISKELDISEDDIVTILGEIVDLVKD